MARNRIHIDAPPSAVWDLLDDPSAYPRWVVGADRTLSADPNWPDPGSTFEVALPLGRRDHTRVKAVDPGRRLIIDAAAGTFGPARTTISLEPEGEGTLVTIVEDPAGKLFPLRLIPPVHWIIRVRNRESLRRMRALVLQRQRANADTKPAAPVR